MILFKNYFVSATQETDCFPIVHDVRFAIRDSQLREGLVTITLPEEGAYFLLRPEGTATDLRKAIGQNDPTLVRCATLSIPFQNRELALGPRQMIWLVDTGSRERRREFRVQVMGEEPKQAQAGRPGGRPQRR